MRNLILGAASFALAAVAFPLTASAEVEYPYCAKGRNVGGGCSYATIEQCRAFASGTGAYCYENPRYRPGASALARTPRSRR
jgi:hypothetical protein